MNARAHTWTRGLVAAGLALSLGSCGYIEDLIEDTATNSPADVSNVDAGAAASLATLASKLALVEGLGKGFGSGAAGLGKADGARFVVSTGSGCPMVDVTGFNPDTYDKDASKTSDVVVVNTYVDSVGGETCDDDDTPANPVTGMYTVTAGSLDDETWPDTLDEFLAFDWAADNTYTTRYEFTDIMVTLAGPDVTASNLNGTLDASTTGRTRTVVNKGNINTVLTTPNGPLTARLNMVDVTTSLADLTIPETELTSGSFRIAVTLLGYVDVGMTDIEVDKTVCPNHPFDGDATFTGAGGESVSVDYGTPATCGMGTVAYTPASAGTGGVHSLSRVF